MTIAMMFPGQGAQQLGMGAELFDKVEEFRSIEGEIDKLLGFSPRDLCLNDPDNLLKETQYTQPCVYVVNALHYFDAVRKGLRPDYVLGHSLGEYNALLAANVFDFLTGLRIVQKRGELMMRERDGAMAAVVGISEKIVRQIIYDNALTELTIANFNSSLQHVISGPRDEVERVAPIFEKAGATLYLRLQVSGAFHSPHMIPAARAFADFLEPVKLRQPSIPVIANITARPYAGSDAWSIKGAMTNQMFHPVQWQQSVQYLVGRGVDGFLEMGPGTVLTQLVQYIKKEN